MLRVTEARWLTLMKLQALLIFTSLLADRINSFITIDDVINNSIREEETSLTADDFSNAPVREIDLQSLGLPITMNPTKGNKFEGDIQLIDEIALSDRQRRAVVRHFSRKWPTNEIPYTISSRYGRYSRSVIAKAIQEIHSKTCVKFVPRNEKNMDYLHLAPIDGCYSIVGRAGGRQEVSLDIECMQSGTVQHELMHVLGFFHEQSRPDRDEYIEIIWQNVDRDSISQFQKYSSNFVDMLGFPYDYSSLMHYGPYAFTRNGRRTIIPLKRGADDMGQREQFSAVDIAKINKIYSCETTQTQSPTSNHVIDTSSECVDRDPLCIHWVTSKLCSNSEFAWNMCEKTCKKCKKTNHDCSDTDLSCPVWARKGFCTSPLQFTSMSLLCPKSCGQCSTNIRTECSDQGNYFTCRIAVLFDECNAKRRICAKSCGFC